MLGLHNKAKFAVKTDAVSGRLGWIFALTAVLAIIGSKDNAIFAVPTNTNRKTIIGAIKIMDFGKRSIILEARKTK